MSIHPAVAPSGATGLAGSLMRRHRRLLLERSLTRQFLSASETANQVRRERGEKREPGDGIQLERTHIFQVILRLLKNPTFTSFTVDIGFSFSPDTCKEQHEGWIGFHIEIIKAAVINCSVRLSERCEHKQ